MAKKTDIVAFKDKSTGKFLPGNPGGGRTPGSKNKITVLKVALEEAFREELYDDIAAVLRQVVDQALKGDKASQKMVWEASISKGLTASDKDAKSDKGFTVHHVHHDKDNKGKEDAK